MCDCPTLSDISGFIKDALPFISVAVGWFVVSSFQDRRERRKEIRALIDESKEIIEEVYTLSISYYCRDNKEYIGELSQKIEFKLMMISQYLIVINQAGLKTGGSQELIDFNQIVSGDRFETSNYTERFDDHEWRSELSPASQELIMHLEKKYFSTFRMRSMPMHDFS